VIVEEGQRLQMMINVMAELQPGTSGDTSSADELLACLFWLVTYHPLGWII